MNEYMTRYRPNVRMYMSVHSFGDMVLWPWGFSGSPGWISNWQYHQDVGMLWADAIRAVTGKVYRVGKDLLIYLHFSNTYFDIGLQAILLTF